MRFSLVLLLFLAGCAGAPEIEPQTFFQDADTATLPDVRPAALPASPEKTFVEIGGKEAVAFVGPEADRLNLYIKTLQDNTEIARLAADALRAKDAESRALIEAGRLTERQLNLETARAVRLEKKLADSELWRAVEGWGYKLLLLGLIFIGI